jgi:hypothetical protein
VIEYFAATLLAAGFVVVLKACRVVENSVRAVSITNSAVEDIRSPTLDDDAKEARLQRHAKQLFGLFFLITAGGAAAVFLPVAAIWILDRLQVLSFDGVLRATVSWQFLAATTLLVVLIILAKRFR